MSTTPATPATPAAPAAPSRAEAAGRRVDEILARLTERGDPAAGAAAEELVRSLMEFYGAGLARVLELVPDAKAA